MTNVTITAPPSLPGGTYPAIFQGLLDKMSREGVVFLIWMFLITTMDGQIEVTGASSQKQGPKSKAFRWFTALLGRRPVVGETLGDNLVGRTCLLVIEQDEDGFSNVADVLPSLKATQDLEGDA